MAILGKFNNDDMQPCIDQCMQCLQACEECLTLCVTSSHNAEKVTCMMVLRDCIDICDLAVKFMSRGSSHAHHICKECTEICEKCAQECDKMAVDHCKKCAEICRKCAAECKTMM
jgi:hypothetical protein